MKEIYQIFDEAGIEPDEIIENSKTSFIIVTTEEEVEAVYKVLRNNSYLVTNVESFDNFLAVVTIKETN